MAPRSSNTTQRRTLRPPGGRSARQGSACVVVIHGENLGLRLELDDKPVVIGRSPDVELQINHRSISRLHCRIWREASGYRIRDLDSTNKTFLNEQPILEAELRDGDHIGVGDSVLKFMEQGSIEARYHEELYQLATSDPLTGLYNRRQFQELMEKEILRATRHLRTLCLALVDIDHFKPINDRYGHPAGDVVIRGIAQLLRHNARADQLIARIGGEEFALVFAEQSLADERRKQHEPDGEDERGAELAAGEERRGVEQADVVLEADELGIERGASEQRAVGEGDEDHPEEGQ